MERKCIWCLGAKKQVSQRARMAKTWRLKLDINIFSFEIAGKFLLHVKLWNSHLKAPGIRYLTDMMNPEKNQSW